MWFIHRREQRLPERVTGQELGELVEAYLEGRYLEYLRRRGAPVPGWARTNAFAHGTTDDLRRAASCPVPYSAFFDDATELCWAAAERLLANELLVLVSDDTELLWRIQHGVLIPLELRLIAAPEHADLTPGELVRATRAALRSSII